MGRMPNIIPVTDLRQDAASMGGRLLRHPEDTCENPSRSSRLIRKGFGGRDPQGDRDL